MPALIDVSAISINPLEVPIASQILFEKTFNNPALTEIHDVHTGIKMKTQIVLAQRLNKVLGKASVSCVPNPAGGFTLSQKYWDPAREDFRLEHCAADLPVLLKIFQSAQKMNPDFYDAIGSEEMSILISVVEEAMNESIFTKVWIADKTAAVTPAGVFAVGTDLGLFNTFDGLFKQIQADVASGKTPRVVIAENAGASYVAQELLPDAAYNTFKEMFRKQDTRLSQQTDAQLLVTRSMYDNFMDTLETKSANYASVETIQNGFKTVMFRGVKVIQIPLWDRQFKSYQDNGVKVNNPHRAVLTLKSNIPVGTMSTEDLSNLDSFYDRKSKTNIIDAAYTLDAQHLESYLTVIAY